MDKESTGFDGAKFAQAILQNQRRMRAVVLAIVPGCCDADDILQEACSAMWRKIADYDQRLPFAPWAGEFVRMQTMAYLKRKKRDRLVLSGDNLDAIQQDLVTTGGRFETHGHNRQRIEALESCLLELKPHDRVLLRLRYVDGRSVAEIAADGASGTNGKSSMALYKVFARLQVKLLRCIECRMAE